MRLFVSIDLSDECKIYLAKVISKIKKEYPDLSFVSPDKLHLTLKFLGDVQDDNLSSIIECLSSVSFDCFSVSLSEFGVFSDENYFRVVWVGLSPEIVICGLQKRIDSSLSNLFPEEKSFLPHITLARIKFMKDKSAFIKFIESLKIKPVSFEVKEFKLVKSTLQRAGSLYEVIKVFPCSYK